ncbi:ABC transporter permease [Lacticaseibacillus kribbianus]|uniref:ABC transporter permease n=1 Tax=Lacticaseibacillus kribbianus TaxID=2926292 RepID=UPI001CD4808F|nr:ABC transporter permease [Lacticaseibacillus kribbianus]
MSSAWVVLKQTYLKNVKSAGWLSLVLAPLVAALAVAGIAYFLVGSSKPAKVAVVGPAEARQAFVQATTKDQRYVAVASAAAAEQATARGDYDGVLTLHGGRATLVQRKGGESVDQTLVAAQLRQLATGQAAAKLGLSAKQVATLLATPQLTVKTAKAKGAALETDAGDTEGGSNVLAIGMGFLLYLFLMTYGSIIAQEIATEKSSRIEESILSAITAGQQFVGKILGIAALLLTQLAVYAVAGGAAFALHPEWWRQLAPYLNGSQSTLTIAALLAGFLLGVLQYSLLAAATGALVSSVEQAGMALMPVMMLAMVGYMASIMVPNGQTTAMAVLSYVPFTAPMVMPVRVAAGQVGLTQALVAGGVNLAFLVLLFWGTMALYRVSVLVYDQRGLRAALSRAIGLLRTSRAE